MARGQQLRLLYVSDFVPSPAAGNAGGKVFAHYIEEMHRRGHSVAVLALGQDSDSVHHNDSFRALCQHFEIVDYDRAPSKRLTNILLRTIEPPEYAIFRTLGFQGRVARLLQASEFDVIHAIHPWLLRSCFNAIRQVHAHASQRPVLLGHVMDIATTVFFGQALKQPRLLQAIHALKFARMSLFEFDDYARADSLLVHATVDEHILRAFIPHEVDIYTSPIWFEAADQLGTASRHHRSADIIYVGNSADKRMRNALDWFLPLVWPLVTCEVPNAKLHIAGVRREHAHLWNGFPNVVCHPIMETQDLLSLYDQCSVLIFPLRDGHYSKHVKLLNAFARGCVVVMTPEANSSERAVHGLEALIASDPTSFAREVVRVLSDPIWADQLAHNALTKLRCTYTSPTIVADSLETAYFETINHSDPSTHPKG